MLKFVRSCDIMGLDKPSIIVTKIYGKYGRSIGLAKGGVKNSRTDFYDEKTGDLLQQRWYDENGQAIWDRDWSHNNSLGSHKFPHDHPWDWSKDPARQDSVDYINKHFK